MGIQAGIYFLPVGGFIGLVVLTALMLALGAALILQIVQSPLSGARRAAWIVAAILFPAVSTALWYFLAPRTFPTEEERLIASNFFAEIGQPI